MSFYESLSTDQDRVRVSNNESVYVKTHSLDCISAGLHFNLPSFSYFLCGDSHFFLKKKGLVVTSEKKWFSYCACVGTGTWTSHHAVMRCVWWCTTNHLLPLVWEGYICSSGTMTTAKPRTTLSVNTQQVLLHVLIQQLVTFFFFHTTHCCLSSLQSIPWSLPLPQTPHK